MRPLLILLAIAACITAFILPQRAHTPSGYGKAAIGGAFTLTDTKGHDVHDADFRGRLMLVYMGYSHCPDICPMTLTTMSESLKGLDHDANKVAMIFISLDPERDTPQALGDYLKAFDPRIIGLTGNAQEIAQAAKAYKAYYKKNPVGDKGEYLIDHSGFLYLLDTKGDYLAHFPSGIKAQDLTQAIKAHL